VANKDSSNTSDHRFSEQRLKSESAWDHSTVNMKFNVFFLNLTFTNVFSLFLNA